jgi:uncharacterized protein YhaN
MEEIVKKDWKYVLYRTEQNQLLLSVVCGSVALYDLNFILNSEEKELFRKEGVKFLDELAEKVSYSPQLFEERKVEI